MKQLFTILVLQCLFFTVKAGYTFKIPQHPVAVDTNITVDPVEEEIIAEVIKTKAPPPLEKVQYVSQVTKYGFKNLFAKYNYNPSLPYSSQVNPNAESYMQDYLRAHSNSLIKMKGWGQP